jgi:hypothetical protein
MQPASDPAAQTNAPLCPRCDDSHVVPGRSSTALLSAVGALAGGLHGWLHRSTAAAAGAQVGRLLGSVAGPVGQTAGLAGGAVLGALIGAATGLALGNSLGHLVDRNIVGSYRCLRCGHRFTFTAAVDSSSADMHWPRQSDQMSEEDVLGA